MTTNVCLSIHIIFIVAPESVESSAFSTKSDIWSVGCTVIELLTGKPPYSGMEPSAALFKITLDPHPPIPEGLSVVNTKHNKTHCPHTTD